MTSGSGHPVGDTILQNLVNSPEIVRNACARRGCRLRLSGSGHPVGDTILQNLVNSPEIVRNACARRGCRL